MFVLVWRLIALTIQKCKSFFVKGSFLDQRGFILGEWMGLGDECLNNIQPF